MKNQKYTITDVAQMLNVSPSTVSRAMNNSPGVSAAVRKKILAFVAEVGYQPNTFAQSLSSGKSNMVALILGDIRNPFYADLSFGIQAHLNKQGFIVTTFNSEYDFEKEKQFIQIATQYGFGGIILVTVNGGTSEDYLTDIHLPLLLVNRIKDNYLGSLVITDNFQAGYTATRHLINVGHKKIGFFSGHHSTSTASLQRYQGYKQALQNYQLSYNEDFCMFDLDWKMRTGYKAAERLYEKKTQMQDFPTALLVANDLLALGFMDYCSSHDIRVPEDISIVGFDDIEYSSLHSIQLTTVSQHVKTMCEESANVMVELMEHPNQEPKRVILEPTLMIRKTTCPPNTNL